MPNDIIRLCFGKALITGNKPGIVALDKFNLAIVAEPKLDLGSFGLFETSQPNYTTYYPDVTAEDLAPKEEDFYYPVVRSLSEVIVHKKRNPIDFGLNDVLKSSMGMLKGQTVNADHETALGNAMGAIRDVSWQDGYETNGVKIPAGINSELKLDGKSNPRIVRLMKMDPPGIHSVSVTVEFAWEKSHPLPDNEFFSKLATFDDKGKMYKRNVTKVMRYHEISLVGHGADPFAMLVNDKGHIVNPKYAHISYNSAEEKAVGGQYYFFDMATDVIKNSTIPIDDINNDSTETANMKEAILLITALAAASGTTITLAEDATAIPADLTTRLTAIIKKLKTDSDSLAVANTKIADLETKVTAAGNVTELKSFQDAQLSKIRSEALKNYNLANKTPDANVITAINSANYDALVVLNTTYLTQVEAIMPLTCKDCNSKNVSRASAKPSDPEGGVKEAHVIKNNQDTIASLRKSQRHASILHGVEEEKTTK